MKDQSFSKFSINLILCSFLTQQSQLPLCNWIHYTASSAQVQHQRAYQDALRGSKNGNTSDSWVRASLLLASWARANHPGAAATRIPRAEARRPALEWRGFQRRRWRRRRLQERRADEGFGGGARTGLQGCPRYGEWMVGSGDRRADGAPGVAGDDSFSFFKEKTSSQGRWGTEAGSVRWVLACWEGGVLLQKHRGASGGWWVFFCKWAAPSPKPLDPDPAVQVGVSIVCTTCLVST
jgi:hypothetical protein